LKDSEIKYIKELHLLTYKPFIYAVNVSEDQLDLSEEELRGII